MKKNKTNKLSQIFATIGAGAVLMSSVMGPGSLATMLVSGSGYGYMLLWIVLLACILSGVVSYIGGKIAVVKDKNLYEFFADELGNVPTAILLIIVLITWSIVIFSQGATLLETIKFFLGTDGTLAIIAFIVVELVIGYVFTAGKNNAQNVAGVMVTLLSILFLVNMIIIKPDLGKFAGGLIPRLPSWSKAGIIASIVGSSAPGTSAGWYSYGVIDSKKGKPLSLKSIAIDQTYFTILFIIFCLGAYVSAAEVLYPAGIEVNSVLDGATALEPLVGPLAKWILALGFFGALFTTVGGMSKLLSQGFETLLIISKNKRVYRGDSINFSNNKIVWVGILISILGGFIAKDAMKYLVNFIGFLTVGGFIILLLVAYFTNSKKHMGENTNSLLLNIMIILLILINGYSAFSYIFKIFG